MIIDAGEGCQTASFKIGRSSGTTREWNIKVLQYECGNDDVSGPPGCLQYYTEDTGTIQSFNFPQPTVTTITATGAQWFCASFYHFDSCYSSTVTHLARQNYDVCIRRSAAACYICYSSTITLAPGGTASENNQDSFGLR